MFTRVKGSGIWMIFLAGPKIYEDESLIKNEMYPRARYPGLKSGEIIEGLIRFLLIRSPRFHSPL